MSAPSSRGAVAARQRCNTTRSSLDSSFDALTGGGVYAGVAGNPRRVESPDKTGRVGRQRLYASPTKRPLPMLELSLLARGVIDGSQQLRRFSRSAGDLSSTQSDEFAGETKAERVQRLHGEKLEAKRERLEAIKRVKEQRFELEQAAKAKERAVTKAERTKAQKKTETKRTQRALQAEQRKAEALRQTISAHAQTCIKRELDAARWDQQWRAKHADQLAQGPKVRGMPYVDDELRWRSEVPGPGKYNPQKAEAGGLFGKIGDQNPKSEIEQVILRAETLPGPSDYTPGPTVFGQSGSAVPAPKFSNASTKSELEWIIYNAKDLPGPDEYSPDKAPQGPQGTVFSTSVLPNFFDLEMSRCAMLPSAAEYDPCIDVQGFTGTGRFSEARPKTDVERSILRYKYEPGPGQYTPQYVRQFSTSSTRVGAGVTTLNVAKAKTEQEWIAYRQKQLPGPADTSMPEPAHREKLQLRKQAKRQAELELESTLGSQTAVYDLSQAQEADQGINNQVDVSGSEIFEGGEWVISRHTGEDWRPGGKRGSLGPRVEAALQTSFERSFGVPTSP